MTDNEKRAHDLAISMIPIIYSLDVGKGNNIDSKNLDFNAYIEYKKLYDMAIPLFDKDFTSQE